MPKIEEGLQQEGLWVPEKNDGFELGKLFFNKMDIFIILYNLTLILIYIDIEKEIKLIDECIAKEMGTDFIKKKSTNTKITRNLQVRLTRCNVPKIP